MLSIKRIAAVCLIAAICLPALHARRQRTSPSRRLREVPVVAAPDSIAPPSALADTIELRRGDIRLSGFDKEASSSRESFFATNCLPDSVSVIELTVRFDYTDMRGRQLHSAVHTVRCHIPPGQTRRLEVRTWDSQRVFYYYRSNAPKRRKATAFNVKSELIGAVVVPVS